MKPAVARSPWREKLGTRWWFFALEFSLIAGIFVADEYHDIYLSKTPYLLALAWISLALRKQSWRAIGLTVPTNWKRLLLIGMGAGVAMELLELFATQPLLVALTGKYPDLSDLKELVGNVSMLLIAVVASWILAAIGEELAWRGYILNRVADLLGRTRMAWAVSVVVVSLFFGLAHAYQGWTGMLENAIDGALLAVVYLACGRNLIAPIVAHGITDTLDSLIVFSGHYPGMR